LAIRATLSSDQRHVELIGVDDLLGNGVVRVPKTQREQLQLQAWLIPVRELKPMEPFRPATDGALGDENLTD